MQFEFLSTSSPQCYFLQSLCVVFLQDETTTRDALLGADDPRAKAMLAYYAAAASGGQGKAES